MGLAALVWAKRFPAALSPMARLCLLDIADNGYPEECAVETSAELCAAAWNRPAHEARAALDELASVSALIVLDADDDSGKLTVLLTTPGWERRYRDHLEEQRWRPVEGKPVVYTLYADAAPVYIGSTGNLRGRLAAHRSAGRIAFDTWSADVMVDRETAYGVEAEQIALVRPRFNRAGVTR